MFRARYTLDRVCTDLTVPQFLEEYLQHMIMSGGALTSAGPTYTFITLELIQIHLL